MYTSLHLTALVITVAMHNADVSCVSDGYLQQRTSVLKAEKSLFVGGKIKLSDKENEANEIILRTKSAELAKSHANVSEFLPAQHFFLAKGGIERSGVFSAIKKLPKGASLHTHLLAAVSVDYIVRNITYRDNIYGCFINGIYKLRFLQDAEQDVSCTWKSLKEQRDVDANFDVWLRKQLSLEVDNPRDEYPTPDVIWQRFKKIFSTAYDMMCYKPVFEDYVYQLLKELYADNVIYTELRGTFMPLYELNGTVYSTEEFFDLFIAIVKQFQKDHPKFLGVRYIHSIYRGVTPEVLKSGLDELIALSKLYPDFIAGFDFVGYEEEGNQLVVFHEVLAEAGKHLKFFFHAGETNWYGHTDLNLVDAVLLNSSRIGHGFGLDKHPVVADMALQRCTCLELCPISNQVLMLISDPRNHPVTSLMAKGFPVVICNDDPSAWGASGLSYDWYVAFMAMTPENAGIEVLKQFAMNSILYSAMKNDEKITAMKQWNEDWQKFLDDVIKTERCS